MKKIADKAFGFVMCHGCKEFVRLWYMQGKVRYCADCYKLIEIWWTLGEL